jgi:hypothetical protein
MAHIRRELIARSIEAQNEGPVFALGILQRLGLAGAGGHGLCNNGRGGREGMGVGACVDNSSGVGEILAVSIHPGEGRGR